MKPKVQIANTRVKRTSAKVKVKREGGILDALMQVPEFDTHFSPNRDYQMAQQANAYKLCQSRRRAIDIGAHVGYWSRNMIRYFAEVEAFEPDADNRACFVKNVPTAHLHAVALGEAAGECHIVIDAITNSGAKHIEDGGDILVLTLDCYGYTDVDLIKIDTQGSELAILRGARQTIEHSHPIMVVEMPKHEDDPGIEDFLTDLGYQVVQRYLADWIYKW